MARWGFGRQPRRDTRPVVSNPAKKGSLVAAGQRVHQREAQIYRRLIQPWQQRALSYYDSIGEIKYAANYVGHAMSLLNLFVGQIADDGQIEQTDNQAAVEALARIQDPGGGRGVRYGLQEQYGKLMFLTGEAYLLVSNDSFTNLEQWEMLSTNELRVMDGIIMRYRAPSLMIQDYREAPDEDFFPLGADAVVYRLWKRSPVFSALADSSMTGVLLLAEELLKLTAVVRARATSRLAGPGIVFIDEALSQTPLEPTGDEDPLNDILMQDFIEAATSAIENEGSAAAVSPMFVRIPVPDGKKIQDVIYHLQITDPIQLYPETGLREECIRRIATGLDIPAEILTGMGELTHWNAWQVDESTWKAHLQPMAQQLVSDLTMAYLRPYLRDQNVPDWDTFVIDYDASAIINHPDRGAAADAAYDKGTLSDESYRKAKGFDEDDAPSEEEKDMWLGVKVRDASLAKYGIPSLKPGGLKPEAGVVEMGDASSGGGEVVAPKTVATPTPAETVKDQPPQPVSGDVLGSGFAVAGELAVLRARELAGAKIRNQAKRDPESLALLEGVRHGLVAYTLGRDKVRELCRGMSDAQLVSTSGAGSGVEYLVEEALRRFGVTDQAVIRLIVSNVEKHAAQTLYDERPRPLPEPLLNRVAQEASRNGHKTQAEA